MIYIYLLLLLLLVSGTVRIWHANTYRLESTLNYGLERVWTIACQKGSNNVALGYDEGSIIIKVTFNISASLVHGLHLCCLCSAFVHFRHLLFLIFFLFPSSSSLFLYLFLFLSQSFKSLSYLSFLHLVFVVLFMCLFLFLEYFGVLFVFLWPPVQLHYSPLPQHMHTHTCTMSSLSNSYCTARVSVLLYSWVFLSFFGGLGWGGGGVWVQQQKT